jgi:hypothetical protein
MAGLFGIVVPNIWRTSGCRPLLYKSSWMRVLLQKLSRSTNSSPATEPEGSLLCSQERAIELQWTQHNSEPGWPLTGREGKSAKRQHIRRDNPVLPCIVSYVKLLRSGCRSSACGLRRVPVLPVFYSSVGSQNIVECKSHCIKMQPIVWKLKGENVFSYTVHAQTTVLLSLAPSIFPSPLSVT